MALPSSGELSLDGINVQLRRPSGAAFSLDDAQARGLAGKPWGAIAVSDFHGKWAGERMTVGAGGAYYGYSNSVNNYSGTVFGAMNNARVFNEVVDELAWTGGALYILMAAGVAKPTQTQLIIRDANFGAVLTLNIPNGNWFNTGRWSVRADCANPFPNGATRWITWA